MVDRVLFGAWQQADINDAMSRASKTGWSPIPNGFYDVLGVFPKEVLATDCSAFDWTFPAWVVQVLIDLKLELMRGTTLSFESAARKRFSEVLGTGCTIRLPDGSRYRQLVQGIMKSGWLLTISANSDAQELITLLAWSRAYTGPCPRLWSMGDDVLMRWQEGLPSGPLELELKRAGILSKFAVPEREFAGFKFGRDSVTGEPWVDPLYPDKHKYLLAHTQEEDLEEVVTSHGLLYSMARLETSRWIQPLLDKYSRWTRSVYKSWAYGHLMTTTKLVQTDDAAGMFALN